LLHPALRRRLGGNEGKKEYRERGGKRKERVTSSAVVLHSAERGKKEKPRGAGRPQFDDLIHRRPRRKKMRREGRK